MRYLYLIPLLACVAFAQSTNGIVTSVSRTVNVTPDEGDFIVLATTTLDTTQQQVVEILRGIGVQNLNIVGLAVGPNTSSYPPVNESQLYYQITFVVAPTAMKDYAKRLDAMRASPPAEITSLQYGATLNASSAAVETTRQNLLPQLISEAKTKAQSLAAAGGLKLGPVQGISESSYALGGVPMAWFSVPSFISSQASSSSGAQFTFYTTVTFGVSQ
jgi:uncharacterized protein YggE